MTHTSLQQKFEIQATAKALETLAQDIHESAGDAGFVAINSFRASLAVLSLRGQADRLQLIRAEQQRVAAIICAAADRLGGTMFGAAEIIRAFDHMFPEHRLIDLGVDRAFALETFARQVGRAVEAES